jgi:RNA polymerase sigma-70 factor (ECF subfamily)
LEDAAKQVEAFSDEWLMRSYSEGNETCFSVLIQRYERELYSYLRRLLTDAAMAEDVFQNTFLQVHLKRHLYDTTRPFRPWLYTIATHQAIDAMRRNQRHQRASLDTEHENLRHDSAGSLLDMLAGNAGDPHVHAERSERSVLVRQAVDGLSEHLRAVVVLSYYQGMKYKEIADILDIPVGTVKSRLHAAIRRLGDVWEKLGLSAD